MVNKLLFGATIYTPDKIIDRGYIHIRDELIHAVGTEDELEVPAEAESIDASGLLLVPGFIDLKLNGGFGHDFTTQPKMIWHVAQDLPRFGVTSFLPTIVSCPLARIAAAQAVLEGESEGDRSGAVPLGLHLEGPFLNPQKVGAHEMSHLRTPKVAEVINWRPENGVRLVTLAPELPDSTPVIEHLKRAGIVVAAGHTAASYDQGLRAIKAGVTYASHLFNAMSPLGHREPGLITAMLESERCLVGLIVDGVHLHPAIVNLVWSIKGPNKVTLVTNAISGLGMSPGRFTLGDQEMIVTAKDARLEDGTLAGSILSMDAALRNLIQFCKCSLEDALPSLTSTPASLLGIHDQRGEIAAGMRADIVLLTPDLEVASTFVAGTQVYKKGT